MFSALLVALSCAALRPPDTGADPAATQRASADFPQAIISPKVPPDVESPSTVKEADSQPFFDDLSWRTFVALNWPAVEGKRDVPDQNKNFGDSSPLVVWQTWKTADELFQPDGAEPSAWDSFEAISRCKDIANADAGRVNQLLSFTSLGPALESINRATEGGIPVGPLVAQNRTYVRYEVRMNKRAYNYIRGDPNDPATTLYRRDKLLQKRDSPLSFPEDSIQVRAAWRQFLLPQEKDILDRYYHVEALLVNPQTKEGEKKIMGLVGLHIAHKTPTRPQWVWSTFEHVDNVVPIGPGAPPNTRPTFQDPNGPTKGDDVNKLPSPINAGNPPQPCPDPVQVVRMKKIDDGTQKTNDRFQNHCLVKDTVWKNYQLVATQWPTNPQAGGTGEPFPKSGVANVTMETGVPSNSCMICHGHTQNTDFVWVVQLRAHPRTEGAAPLVEALQESQQK
jgi:hypothetical protein